MKIAILGSGSMGMLYGGFLAKENQVTMLSRRQEQVDKINAEGLFVTNMDGSTLHVTAKACLNADSPVDLVILFVKSMDSAAALEANRKLFDENTILLTLQNGSGHESLLKQFVSEKQVAIGVTNHNAWVTDLNKVSHGSAGPTNMGLPFYKGSLLEPVASAFCRAGFETEVRDNIQKLIWEKLFVNTSVSALTGALQVEMGFICDNPHARTMMEALVHESVAVANAQGHNFVEADIQKRAFQVAESGKSGITSICADMRAGRKTEVDTISGSVVRASEAVGVAAPSHKFIVELIHAQGG